MLCEPERPRQFNEGFLCCSPCGESARRSTSNQQGVPSPHAPAPGGSKRMEPERRRIIELRCAHGNPEARDPRVRYICPSSAVLWALGVVGIVSYVVLAALRH